MVPLRTDIGQLCSWLVKMMRELVSTKTPWVKRGFVSCHGKKKSKAKTKTEKERKHLAANTFFRINLKFSAFWARQPENNHKHALWGSY